MVHGSGFLFNILFPSTIVTSTDASGAVSATVLSQSGIDETWNVTLLTGTPRTVDVSSGSESAAFTSISNCPASAGCRVPRHLSWTLRVSR